VARYCFTLPATFHVKLLSLLSSLILPGLAGATFGSVCARSPIYRRSAGSRCLHTARHGGIYTHTLSFCLLALPLITSCHLPAVPHLSGTCSMLPHQSHSAPYIMPLGSTCWFGTAERTADAEQAATCYPPPSGSCLNASPHLATLPASAFCSGCAALAPTNARHAAAPCCFSSSALRLLEGRVPRFASCYLVVPLARGHRSFTCIHCWRASPFMARILLALKRNTIFLLLFRATLHKRTEEKKKRRGAWRWFQATVEQSVHSASRSSTAHPAWHAVGCTLFRALAQ